jgi:signal transduction histidine kinase
MKKKLRALVAEDSVDDFDLLLIALQRDYDIDATRVETSEAMTAALRDETWDVVFSDWSMPAFSAMEALKVLRTSGLDLPFLIVSGTVGEETAVEALRTGAHDFLIKHRLARLTVAVDRELREASMRRERARINEQLMISDRMASVGILAAGVAHEINNPLAAVIANLDLALADVDSLDPSLGVTRDNLREELTDARSAADRVRHIVRDLRIFSRSEDDKRAQVDVEKVLESTLRMAANEIRHRARIVRRYAEVPPVDASEGRLGQVFLNLVVNAAQALPEGHADRNEIRVSTSCEGAFARIEISDTGPGIPADVMKRLFTPFVTTKPQGVGTGLGLSICHRIITDFGGEILVNTSERGTTFTVLLPLSRVVTSEASTAKPSAAPRTTRRAKILAIDDEPMIAKVITRAIGRDHDVTTTNRGRDALDLVRGGARFDLILCDLMMPEMTGAEVFDEMRRIAPEQAAAIVFLTGGAFTPSAQQFLDGVANRRLEKPFEASAILEIINERLS